jgi:hypothetical protein
MLALTLLDGTTLQVPARARTTKRGGRRVAEAEPVVDPPPVGAAEMEGAPPSDRDGDALRARDIVAALRAQARGADASEILGENVRWEAMFAALLTLLLKKKLILDWEFVEEFKKL